MNEIEIPTLKFLNESSNWYDTLVTGVVFDNFEEHIPNYLNEALQPFGVYVYVDPMYEGGGNYQGVLFSKIPLTQPQVDVLSTKLWIQENGVPLRELYPEEIPDKFMSKEQLIHSLLRLLRGGNEAATFILLKQQQAQGKNYPEFEPIIKSLAAQGLQ